MPARVLTAQVRPDASDQGIADWKAEQRKTTVK